MTRASSALSHPVAQTPSEQRHRGAQARLDWTESRGDSIQRQRRQDSTHGARPGTASRLGRLNRPRTTSESPGERETVWAVMAY
ncbi:hypothetical protein FHX52_3938 [Humibacillus xanthopallidus]|uniref:Uncharacterized protein n=1 Tax=Humibacillus xanthopallidus TaxID=412689 RepID=A0A543PKW4_9MICO|nr:hypothetical protein FHX52_3938 [Humibacillus xanthopallidus]